MPFSNNPDHFVEASLNVGVQTGRMVGASTLSATPQVGAHGGGQAGSVSTLSIMVATPGTALRMSGSLASISRLTTRITRQFIKVNSAIVIQQPGLPACPILGRVDAKAVSLLDTYTEDQTVYGMVYRTRVVQTDVRYLRSQVGEQEVRAGRKRVSRIVVFGEGTLLAGSTITITCDRRTETYDLPKTIPSDWAQQGVLVYQEPSADMTGRVFSVELALNGTGIILTDTLVEMVFVG